LISFGFFFLLLLLLLLFSVLVACFDLIQVLNCGMKSESPRAKCEYNTLNEIANYRCPFHVSTFDGQMLNCFGSFHIAVANQIYSFLGLDTKTNERMSTQCKIRTRRERKKKKKGKQEKGKKKKVPTLSSLRYFLAVSLTHLGMVAEKRRVWGRMGRL